MLVLTLTHSPYFFIPIFASNEAYMPEALIGTLYRTEHRFSHTPHISVSLDS